MAKHMDKLFLTIFHFILTPTIDLFFEVAKPELFSQKKILKTDTKGFCYEWGYNTDYFYALSYTTTRHASM
jgi:hypothetical protein